MILGGKSRTAQPHARAGPWQQFVLSRGDAELKILTESKASPLVLAEKLRALKEALGQIKEYERLDFRNLPSIRRKKNYREVSSIGTYVGPVCGIQVLPDGGVVSGWTSGALYLARKDGRTSWKEEKIGEHQARIHCIQALPDGRIVSGSEDGTLRLWTKEGDETWRDETIGRHEGAVLGLQALPKNRVASATADGVIRIWEREGDDGWICERIPMAKPVSCFQVLPDGHIITVQGNTLLRWSRESGGSWTPEEIGLQGFEISCMQALPDGGILCGALGSTLTLWRRIAEGEWSDEPIGWHRDGVRALQALPGGEVVTVSYKAACIRIWRKAEGGSWEYSEIEEPCLEFKAIQVLTDGTILAGTNGGTIRVFDGDPAGIPGFLAKWGHLKWR